MLWPLLGTNDRTPLRQTEKERERVCESEREREGKVKMKGRKGSSRRDGGKGQNKNHEIHENWLKTLNG